jgi:diketogulonate reductase-like aldo/keto reductase
VVPFFPARPIQPSFDLSDPHRPFTDSPLLSDPDLVSIAGKHSVSPATILISYQVNRGCVVLPKSVTPSRITENLKVIPLDKSDMQFLDGLAANGKQQRVNTPLFGWDLVSCGRGDGCVAGVLGLG